MLSLVACALIVVLLGLAVLASMALENWGRWTVELPLVELAPVDSTPVELAPVDPTPAEPTTPVDLAPVDPTPADGDLVIAGRAVADRAVAVLFAAYAAQRLPEANRASAWATASDWPPSRLGGNYRPGADLRAKPVAVGRLLDCADEGRCWLTLSEETDIGRGLRARPPTCDVLVGIAEVWQATRSALTRLSPDDVAIADAAVTLLAPRWETTTGAPDVEPIAAALRRAALAHAGLVVRVPLEPVGPAEVHSGHHAGGDQAGGDRTASDRTARVELTS